MQRVPVRIRIPEDIARRGLLRPGLSVVAEVHTRDERLPKPTLWSVLGFDRIDLSRFGIGARAHETDSMADATATTGAR